MMICKNCGAANKENCTFCVNCGRSMEQAAASNQTPELGAPIAPSQVPGAGGYFASNQAPGMGGYRTPQQPVSAPNYSAAYLPVNPPMAGVAVAKAGVNKPLIVIFIVVTVILLGIIGVMTVNSYGNYTKIQSLQRSVTTLASERDSANGKLSELQDDYNSLKKLAQSLADENDELRIETEFMEESVVFVLETDNYYHTYHCDRFQNADGFWAFNLEAAKGRSYTSCPECH